jgi:hypothetical protein
MSALNVMNDIARHFPWEALAASGVISPLLVGIKKWFSVQNEKVMISLVILISGLAVAGNYMLHVPTSDPYIIGIQTAVLAFMTQPIYFFIVKPAIAFFKNEVEKAAALNEVKSATVPKGGITVTYGTPAPATAFAATAPVTDFSH